MIFSYFVSFYQANKLRLLILVISIATYFALTVVLLSLNQSLPQIASLPFKTIGVSTIVQKTGQLPESMQGAIFPHSNGPIYQAEIDDLTHLEFVQSADVGLYFWYFDEQYFKTVLGVYDQDSIFNQLLRQNIATGQYSLQKNNILITTDFAQKNHLQIGSQVVFGNHQFTVTAILQPNLSGNIIPADIYMNLNQAQIISRASAEMERIYQFQNKTFVNVVMLQTNPKWTGDQETVIQASDKNYLVFSEKTFNKEILAQISLISTAGKIMFTILGIILMIIFSLIIIYNFKTREKEIAILRMIGWSLKDLKKQFISESALLVGLALVMGNILSLLSLWVLKKQTISMQLPWELSAKPHFLPAENNINRAVSANLPVYLQPWLFVGLSIIFLLLFGLLSYLVFSRIKNIKPSKYLK